MFTQQRLVPVQLCQIFLLLLFLLTGAKMFMGGKSNTLEQYGTGTTRGLPTTADAIKPNTDESGSDFYFFVLKKDAASQLYGTFFGQQDPVGDNPFTFGDHVDGGTSRFDRYGVI